MPTIRKITGKTTPHRQDKAGPGHRGLGFILALQLILAALLTTQTATAQTATPTSAENTESSAVVLMYHRFGDDRFPATNIRMDQLREHIKELGDKKYTVLPVEQIISRLQNGPALPDRTIGITIDDGYKSIYDNAWPLFKEAGLTFTVFISTDAIDQGYDDMMTWDQLREMAAQGITIAAHGRSHLHMPPYSAQRTAQEISHSADRIRAEIGTLSSVFAYPYGETSQVIIQQVKDAGFAASFGQHSGAFNRDDDFYYLPRFSLNERFGDMGRFTTAINALPLPVRDITPQDVFLDSRKDMANPPAIGFTLDRELPRMGQLSCFLSHEGKAKIERLGGVRIEVRVDTPFPKGRTRLNCTLPGSGVNAGRWHWFGQLYYR